MQFSTNNRYSLKLTKFTFRTLVLTIDIRVLPPRS
uniref:Uncharacterized protein n=1 Tax=Arundo donax TaxID=35708 RepID=A0A0A9G454_ARUDO